MRCQPLMQMLCLVYQLQNPSIEALLCSQRLWQRALQLLCCRLMKECAFTDLLCRDLLGVHTDKALI